MKKLVISDVLDQARDRQGLKSDYALCKALGFNHQTFAHWRHGRTMPDEKACQKLADAAGLDADILIAQTNAQRAKDSGAKAIWERIAERLQMSAQVALSAVFAVTFAMGFGATDARAAVAGVAPATISADLNHLYIVSSNWHL